MSRVFLLPLLCLSAPAIAHDYELEQVRVVDGDTIEATVVLGFGVRYRTTVRAIDYDACEVSYRRRTVQITPDEIRRGKAAKAYLESVAGRLTVEDTGKEDAWGRPLVVVKLDGESVASEMRERGYERQPVAF